MEKNEVKEDLRTKRTKKFLAESMIYLLQKDSLEKITIQDICEQAMIHRTTFYTHFEDKYDLFEYVLETIRNDIFNKQVLSKEYENVEELYMFLTKTTLDFLEKNNQIIVNILKNNSNNLTYDLIYSTVEQEIQQLLQKTQVTQIPLPVISNFLTGGFVSLITWWLYNPNKVNKEELSNYIKTLIKDFNYDSHK